MEADDWLKGTTSRRRRSKSGARSLLEEDQRVETNFTFPSTVNNARVCTVNPAGCSVERTNCLCGMTCSMLGVNYTCDVTSRPSFYIHSII